MYFVALQLKQNYRNGYQDQCHCDLWVNVDWSLVIFTWDTFFILCMLMCKVLTIQSYCLLWRWICWWFFVKVIDKFISWLVIVLGWWLSRIDKVFCYLGSCVMCYQTWTSKVGFNKYPSLRSMLLMDMILILIFFSIKE